jgi:translation initiation factor eIF-2B subunit beta
MTIGKSKTVEAFLKAASRKRKFTVIVAETAPSFVSLSFAWHHRKDLADHRCTTPDRFSGRATALSLATSGISVILIPDSSIFSLLPRCTKVLLGPHLISADGSLLSVTGSLPLAVAAKEMRVPVVVVGGMFKFSKGYLGEADWGARDLGTPEEVLESGWAGGRDGGDGGGGEEGEEEVEVVNPRWDVVPARLVDLFITNLYVLFHPPSYT